MSKNLFNGYEALRIAIEMEKDGMAFYEVLAGAAKDEGIKKLALELQEEEKEHVRRFLEMIEAEDLDNAWNSDYLQMLGDYLAKTVKRGIFPSRQDAEGIGRYVATLDEALSVAIHMERQTVEYYEKLHAGCDYPTGKKAFAQIAEEEKRHVVKLVQAREARHAAAAAEKEEQDEGQD